LLPLEKSNSTVLPCMAPVLHHISLFSSRNLVQASQPDSHSRLLANMVNKIELFSSYETHGESHPAALTGAATGLLTRTD